MDEYLAAWAEQAGGVTWDRAWDEVFVPGQGYGAWFRGGRLNVCTNCLDRHLPARRDGIALLWEGEPGDRRAVTYGELHAEVVALAAGLRALGIEPGERVVVHLGFIPEAVAVMLACARIGAIHALESTSLPADALAERIADLSPRVVVTQDGNWRHGVIIPLKPRVDEAVAAASSVENTVVVRRIGMDLSWYEGDVYYDDVLGYRGESSAVSLESDHSLLVAHIANRRGRPMGVVHGSGAFLTYATALHESEFVAGKDDVFWCASDIAWIAGQSHAVYGPLASGGTTVLYEGMLDTPTHARAWEIIERYGVTSLATTPSVVANLRRWTDSPPSRYDLGTLKFLLTAGDVIDAELKMWLAKEVGGGRTAVADGWGQTELGGIVSVTGDTGDRPGAPDPNLDVVTAEGSSAGAGAEGELVLRRPWPGTFLELFGDEDGSAAASYRERYRGCYATGDRARREPDGSLTFLGRIDPVASVSGQLVSLTEIGDALLEHPFVAGCFVDTRPDARTGNAVIAMVIAAPNVFEAEQLAHSIRGHVRETLGGLARPETVVLVDQFPSGLTPASIKTALRALCSATSEHTLEVSAAQLISAAASQT